MKKKSISAIVLGFLTIILIGLFVLFLFRGGYSLNEKHVVNQENGIATIMVDDLVRESQDGFLKVEKGKVSQILEGDKDVTNTFFEDFKAKKNVLEKRFEDKVYTFKVKGLLFNKEVKVKFSYDNYKFIYKDGESFDYYNVNEENEKIGEKINSYFDEGFLCFSDKENNKPVSRYLSVDNIKKHEELFFVNPEKTQKKIEIIYVINGTENILHVEEKTNKINTVETYTHNLEAIGIKGYKLIDNTPSTLIYDFDKKIIKYIEVDSEKWVTIDVDYDNGKPLKTINVLKGDKIPNLGIIPLKESENPNTTFRFLYFSKDGLNEKYNFDEVVENAFTLKAIYEVQENVDLLDQDPNYVKVIVKYTDKDEPSKVLYTAEIRRLKNSSEKIDVHSLKGYEFENSLVSSGIDVVFDTNKVIEISFKKVHDIKVTFNFDNGIKIYKDFTVGDKITFPLEIPKKPRIESKVFEFGFWSLDGVNKFDENTILTESIELIAVYTHEVVEEKKASVIVYFKDVDTNKDINASLTKEGVLDTFESYLIPKINGYVFDGIDEFIVLEYSKESNTYVLPYKKLREIDENQGRVILKFVDVDNNRVLDIKELVGEIGKSETFENTFKEGYVLNDETQASINVAFSKDDQVIIIKYNVKATEKPHSYNIIFNSNGGKGSIPNINVEGEKQVKLTKNLFTKDGYRFGGWSLTLDGEVQYTDEQLVSNLTTEEEITLYAIWLPLTYTIKFDSNTGEGVMENIVATYGENVRLPKSLFTKSGYKFVGWNKDKSFTVEYMDEDFVKNVTEDAEVTLYAVWQNIGLVNYKEEIYLERSDSAVDKTNFTETDFVLDKTNIYSGTANSNVINKTTSLEGFTLNEELSVKTGKVNADGSLVLKLYFVRERHNVEYHYNNGVETVALKYGDTITKHFEDLNPTIQKENFRVAGWTRNNQDYQFGSVMGLENIILNAKYERNKWQVRFNFKVETASGEFIDKTLSDNKFYSRNEAASSIFSEPGFENDTFNYIIPITHQGEEEVIDVNIEKTVKRLTVNVSFELEGVTQLTSGTLPQITRYRFEENVLLPQGLESTGFNFAGFFKDNIEVHNSYQITSSDTSKSVIVIKVRFTEFEQVPYTVIFYKERTNVNPEIDETTYSKNTHFEQIDFTEKTATMHSTVTLDIKQSEFKNKYEGFTPKVLTISKHEGVALKGADKLILEVFYVRNRNQVTFDLDSGTSAVSKLTYTYKYEDLILNSFLGNLPEKENYEFKHFINTKDNLEFSFGTARMENENINLKAVYERNKWKITYSYKEELITGSYSMPTVKTTGEFYSKSDVFTTNITKDGFTTVNVSIQIPSSFNGSNVDTYTHNVTYELKRKTVEIKFLDTHPLVPFESGQLPQNKTYKFGETYNLPQLSKTGYNFNGYKSSKTNSYVTTGDHTVGLSDLDSAITYTAEFSQMSSDRQITLEYGYNGPSGWVNVDTISYSGYVNEVRTENLKTYDEFNIESGNTKITLTFDQVSKTQIITLVKNTSMWVTIKFVAGENATVSEAQFEVIKNRALNGKNQPAVTPPTINPNTGYKVDPSGAWSPTFSNTMQVSSPTTFTSKVVVDESLTYAYTVNYLREGDNFVLHTKKVGTHHVGTLDLGTHPQINGYTTSTPTTMTITVNSAENVLNVMYQKVISQWRDVTIKHMGEDFSGNFTVTLNTETKNDAVNNTINITQQTFTGFTYNTSSPITYQVTGASSQEVIVKYNRNKHNITFNSNGGDAKPNQMTGVYYDQVVNLTVNPMPKLTGHTLVGWTIGETTEEFNSGVSKMPNSSITLKAKWQANTFTVTFNGNNSTSGSMSAQTVTYGVTTNLTLNEYQRNNHKFIGWAKSSTGIVEFEDGADITNYQEEGTLSLYAVWEHLGHAVTLNLNGGTISGETGDPVVKHIKPENFPYVLPTPTKQQGGNSLEFLGWYTQNGASGTKYTVLSSANDYTLYAVWGGVVYYIGEYPQTKVTDTALISALNGVTPVQSSKTLSTSQGKSHTEKWNTVTYQGNKYEKVGSDYFKYEPIANYKLSDGTYYSKYILDYQTFDEYVNSSTTTNVYSNSYVKRYLEQVFKEKAGVTSVGLLSQAQLSNTSNFANDNARKAESTDYAEAVMNGERGKITAWKVYYNYLNYYWINTAYPSNRDTAYRVSPSGHIHGNNAYTYYVFGLRVVVSA